MNICRNLLCALFAFLLLSCSQDDDNASHAAHSGPPVIQFDSFNRQTFMQFRDSVVMFISFTSPTGNVGHLNADKHALEVRDVRLNKPDTYYVPPLAPPQNTNRVSGTLKVVMPPLFILGNSNRQSTHFEVQLRDERGNLSNLVITPAIVIEK